MDNEKNPYLYGHFNRRFKHHHNWYEPFYDDKTDYNTNAKSYYDYLARFNHHIKVMTDLINRLLDRDITFTDTSSIDFTKKGSWIDVDGVFDDVVDIVATLKISKDFVKKTIGKKEYSIKNSSEIFKDGLFSPDYFEILEDVFEMIDGIKDKIDNIENEIINIKNEIKNIKNEINNIYEEIKNINIRIDSMLGLNMKVLRKGRDYEIEFFNGFHAGVQKDLEVKCIETSTTIDFTISSSDINSRILQHADMVGNVLMRHTLPLESVPKSRIFKIKLIGDYAKYNNHEVMRMNSDNNIWNLRPIETRSTWNAVISVHSLPEGFIFAWDSYSDGYNGQLDVYGVEKINMVYGNLNLSLTIKKGD